MRVSDDERRARAALARIGEPGDPELARLVAQRGAGEVLTGLRGGSLPTHRLAHYRTRLDRVDSRRDLDAAAAAGTRLVCPGDSEWPTQLDTLPVPPLALWVRGEGDLRLWALRSVAVVGARASTEYGAHVAGEVAAELAARGWTLVSGAAYGIDAAAHRGALAVDGRTIAVIACGVDVAYPRGNASLLERIASDGLIISELAPGCAVTKPRFLERNRVIAALTRGTLVVEAAVRSGALSTAGRARDLSRVVMAVPGPVTSTMSAGCHELVRVGGASLVADAADVLDVLGDLGSDAVPRRRGESRPGDQLDPQLVAGARGASGTPAGDRGPADGRGRSGRAQRGPGAGRAGGSRPGPGRGPGLAAALDPAADPRLTRLLDTPKR